MQVDVAVKMKAEFIYDLLLFHTYSKLSGFLVNVLGLAVMITGGFLVGAGKIPVYQGGLYFAAGIVFLGFTPMLLRGRSNRLMKLPKYRREMTYSFTGEGIVEQLGDNAVHHSWDEVRKAIATPKDIAFYIGADESMALIVPKESFGDNFMPVMKLIAENVTRDRIYIR